MGFVVVGGPNLQAEVKKLQPKILSAIEKAATEVGAGRANTECQRWFGDVTPAFKKDLAKKLRSFRSVVNLKEVRIHFASIKERERNENAAAYQPTNGWQDNSSIQKAQTQSFEMHINEAFSQLPTYCTPSPAATNGQSKFDTLVHELSHLFLNTEDESYLGATAYGGATARLLATNDAAHAKTNAENWGLFIEEFV